MQKHLLWHLLWSVEAVYGVKLRGGPRAMKRPGDVAKWRPVPWAAFIEIEVRGE